MLETKGRIGLSLAALALIGVGLACWGFQFANGLGVTGMSNPFSWGLYIAAFAFFVGVAAGGMIVSSSVYVFDIKDLKPFARIASLSAFGCVVAAGTMVLLDLGKITNILNMFLHPNLTSPLLWDVCVITCYMIITFLSVYFQMLPEWKRSGFFLAAWTRSKSAEAVAAFSQKWSKRVGIVGLPFAVLIHTVTALIFATQASRHWWHSAILPPDFVAMAVASGTALVLVICMIVVGRRGFARHRRAFAVMAKITAGSLVVHFFFTAMELVLLAWENSLSSQEVLHVVFGQYGALYAVEIVLPAIAMVAFFLRRVQKSPTLLYAGSAFVIAGAFVHRMMLLYPGFNVVPLELQAIGSSELWGYPVSAGVGHAASTFVSSFAYVPTAVEWGVFALPVGLALLIVGGGIAFFKFLADEYRS
ncbi:NrfD/PsrC family molybdoenzyme membrane anchor subunit [Arabiibacter massiliensis]|uniref:NrfD/PsrC family molybdoenzyme membrane anchor subunit n=1 Tax=Arabiibacter massiliensis TaxID=1870985 RepID=UPI0009B9B665|nr:NrfD/PsrC family molybdoenzyme membrane anchor subunit [Arabiibacter massiliensis]